MRNDLAEERDRNGREQKGAHSGENGVGQERQQNIDADISPNNRRQHLIGILAQFENPRRIGIAAVDLDLQPQRTEAENRQIKSGKQGGIDDAGRMPSQSQMLGIADMFGADMGYPLLLAPGPDRHGGCAVEG